MNMFCDRFHFKNHVDLWRRQNCNPNKSDNLKVRFLANKIPKKKVNVCGINEV